MDIQKEREAFECEFKQTDYYIAHGDLSTLMPCDDQYALDDVQVSFEMWQAAKAQAVPEGFVLVPKERLANVVDGIEKLFEEDCTLALGELLPIQQDLKAMIEAQEQSHD